MILYLVWDTSGSMAEWGKHLIARGVARAVEQYLRLEYGCAELKLAAWGNDTRAIDWHPDQEFPPELFVSGDSTNAKGLITFFGTEPQGKILLLTDGFWSQADAREFKRWQESLPKDTLRIIKIGTDANPQLKGKDVFVAEEFFAAFDGWMEGGKA